jgi:formate dehydrogenase subunit beta
VIYPVKNENLTESLNGFFRSLLEKGIVDSLLLPQAMFDGRTFSHTLVKNPDKITHSMPFVPVLMNNGGVALGELTAGGAGGRIGAVMRSCEIRAAVELGKFNQTNLDNVFMIGVDCLGTMEPQDFAKALDQEGFTAQGYIADLQEDNGAAVRPACSACPYPVPDNVDMSIGFIGTDLNKGFVVTTSDEVAEQLGLDKEGPSEERTKSAAVFAEKKAKTQQQLLADMKERFQSLPELLNQFARCKRCYNCRSECPICFCNECIFLTNVFEHEAGEYMRWAARKGALRIPYDTLLFHLTRLNHMSFSCVGCGQCSSACPNGLPVYELFQYVGHDVQKIFDYLPGLKAEDEPPITTFREKELEILG